ncbi:MAG: 23S rRNA (uracil(1939)-C(5))-methyltransferase RlmD [Bacteroidaceae bacterium]|nr:23S rRNA (uracil(1939)-C(5))-methyltransferase RlmD [Bacteroidaceae bacterium]
MSRKKKELPIYKEVEIQDVAAEGKALVRIDDLVVFVPYVVPGDVVDLRVTRKKHHYAEAVCTYIHKKSVHRTEPFCPHYGVCGGCKWQILPYEEQLRYKQKQVMDNLERIGKIPLPECSPILGSEKTRCYRNKLEFGFADKIWLTEDEIRSSKKFEQPGAVGFHTSGAFDKILPIRDCQLMEDINNRLRNGAQAYAYEHGLSFFNAREHRGLLRNMMIRLSNTGELMVLMQFCFAPFDALSADQLKQQALEMLAWMHEEFPEVSSLLWVNNEKFNDTIGDLDVQLFSGTDHIFLEMEGLKFKVGPKSFYQTNTEQAYILYKVARELAFEALPLMGERKESPLVYDLYTGTGTIANFVANRARKVIGIEYVPEAIEDAKVNSKINGIENTEFFAGDMKDILNRDFIEKHGKPDIIITDPPRAGMHQDVIDTILFADPQRIVYVSCNPATQARDLQLLSEKYEVKRVQPVDMFPHTQHVENVVLLEKKLSTPSL